MNIAMQSSSHNCPIEISDPDLMSLNMCPVVAAWDNSGASGTIALLVGLMMVPFATLTLGPDMVGTMLVQCGSALLSK